MTDTTKPLSLWHPASLIATVFCIGKIPKAPGTWGSLPAFPIAFAVFFTTGHAGYWILPLVTLLIYFMGTYASYVYMKKTGKHDPGEIVIDEVVGQLITIYMAAPIMSAMPNHGGAEGYTLLFACFVLFRLFDILKPWPIGWLDRKVKGATGVMVDDVAAGVFAGIFLHLGVYLLGAYHFDIVKYIMATI